MSIKRIFGFILLAGAIIGFGNKLFAGMSSYFEDSLAVVLVVLLIGIFLVVGIRQVLRS